MPGWSHNIAVKQRTAANLGVGSIMPDNGQVERVNRTIGKQPANVTIYVDHQQPRRQLDGFVAAYNYSR